MMQERRGFPPRLSYACSTDAGRSARVPVPGLQTRRRCPLIKAITPVHYRGRLPQTGDPQTHV
jgi:hypothetical protein